MFQNNYGPFNFASIYLVTFQIQFDLIFQRRKKIQFSNLNCQLLFKYWVKPTQMGTFVIQYIFDRNLQR